MGPNHATAACSRTDRPEPRKDSQVAGGRASTRARIANAQPCQPTEPSSDGVISAPNSSSAASLNSSAVSSPITNGSAGPSLTPDSTFSSCRGRGGTFSLPTSAEANTGSVGAGIAPTSSDSTQPRPSRKCAPAAVTASVSGNPQPRARPGSRHAVRRSIQPTRMPSVNSTANSASSASSSTRPIGGCRDYR
nr:hypothetical protein [Nonomuraea terrae]